MFAGPWAAGRLQKNKRVEVATYTTSQANIVTPHSSFEQPSQCMHAVPIVA
jgi:hypothetical protein